MAANLLILLLATAGLPPAPTSGAVADFSMLGPTEELRVNFHSNGCFYDIRYNLVFRGGDAPTVTIVTVSSAYSRSAHQPPDVPVVSSVLSDTLIAGLDGLLRFYRSRPRGGCTTNDWIEMVQLRDGVIVATEKFWDGSCASDGTPGVYSLHQLITRVQFGPGPGR